MWKAESLPSEAIWWYKWVPGEEYYQILYCAISVVQTTKKLAKEQYEPSNTQNSNFITIWATEMAQYKIW